MTKAQESPAEIIAKAEQEIAEAAELESTLEQRVLAGDESVGFEQVEQARGMRRFALLRKQAAERKAAEVAARQAAEDFDRFVAAHAPYLAGRDEKLDALFARIHPLIDEAIEVGREHDRHVFALASRAETAGNEWNPAGDPRLIGTARPTEYAWAAVDGARSEVLGAGGVLKRLLAPYLTQIPAFGRYSALRDFLNA